MSIQIHKSSVVPAQASSLQISLCIMYSLATQQKGQSKWKENYPRG